MWADICRVRQVMPAKRIIAAVHVDTQFAGLRDARADVIELVTGERKLHPREREQHKPRGFAQSRAVEQVFVRVRLRQSSWMLVCRI